jgi:dynein heavy chain
VLQQELASCHKLVRYVEATLVELQHAIQGTVVMSVSMEQTLHSITQQQVPTDWITNDAHATPSAISLSQWVANLLHRCDFLHRWVARGRTPSNAFPLSIFSFPQGLFTAVLQRHARKHGIPIHFLDFRFRVLSEEESWRIAHADRTTEEQQSNDGEEAEEVAEGALLTGLQLEGAHWNSELGCLSSTRPGVMRQTMPIIHVLPQRSLPSGAGSSAAPDKASDSAPGVSSRSVIISDLAALTPVRKPLQRGATQGKNSFAAIAAAIETPEPATPLDTYSCPVYRTATRKGTLSTTGTSTNLVLAMELPCQGEPDCFVLNGTALVCSHTLE